MPDAKMMLAAGYWLLARLFLINIFSTISIQQTSYVYCWSCKITLDASQTEWHWRQVLLRRENE